MTQTLEPRPKLRLSNELRVVLAWAATCITSRERGLTWMNGSGQEQFRNWLGGRPPQVGEKVSGHGRWESQKHPLKYAQETGPVTNTLETAKQSIVICCARLKGWKRQ